LFYTNDEFQIKKFNINPAQTVISLRASEFDFEKNRICLPDANNPIKMSSILDTNLFTLSRQAILKIGIDYIPYEWGVVGKDEKDEFGQSPSYVVRPIKVNLVKFDNDTLICIFFGEFNSAPSNYISDYIMIIDYESAKPLLISKIAQDCTDYCLGDFNNDNILDFVHFSWGCEMDTITLYDYYNGAFNLNKTYCFTKPANGWLPEYDKRNSYLLIMNRKKKWIKI